MLRFSLLFLAATTLSAAGLTKDRLIAMIKSSTPEAEIQRTVQAEGLDFEPNSAVLSEIREAGGSLGLTAFLSTYQKNAPVGAPAKPAPRTSAPTSRSNREEARPARMLRPFINLSYTNGGDTLAKVVYTDGSSSSIRAGGETLFKGGLDLQIARPFSVQASFGSHTDSTKEAKNGGMDFKRTALEGLAFWHPTDHWRLGLGVRKTSSAKVTGNGVATTSAIHFDGSTAAIVEIEYLTGFATSYGSRGGISLRYVNEKYTPTSIDGVGPVTGPSVDGSHIGIGFSWYF